MQTVSRRAFLKSSTGLAIGTAAGRVQGAAPAQQATTKKPPGVEVLNPRDRVPLSFVIDDSTCLVNMGYYCTPQFHACYPNSAQYKKDWRKWPREIPDKFVREFGEWCHDHGVKGKYSVVPNPACVGWLDRELPGWSRRELQDSLKLVREVMLPDWDIHPEMITHTRVIDLKTGRPMREISSATMENSYPREKKSVDHLTAYLAYALRLLKNCDLPCEGITTPGGFGNLVKSELSLAVQQAVREVFSAEIPHYFKYVIGGTQSTEPKLEHISGVGSDDVRVTVNVPAGTGDWFGGWQGDRTPEGSRYTDDDATSGRMVDLIKRGQPAVMLCHWPGMYSNGTQAGFEAFKKIVVALDRRYGDQTTWMKLSEMARYWAAKGLTRIERTDSALVFDAPFAAPKFTLRVDVAGAKRFALTSDREPRKFRRVTLRRDLVPDTWYDEEASQVVCLDLPKGRSKLSFA